MLIALDMNLDEELDYKEMARGLELTRKQRIEDRRKDLSRESSALSRLSGTNWFSILFPTILTSNDIEQKGFKNIVEKMPVTSIFLTFQNVFSSVMELELIFNFKLDAKMVLNSESLNILILEIIFKFMQVDFCDNK